MPSPSLPLAVLATLLVSAAPAQDVPRRLGEDRPGLAATVDALRAIDLDGAGGAFIAGSQETTSPSTLGLLSRLDATGAVTWETGFGSTSHPNPMAVPRTGATAVASDGVGGAFVAGWTQGDGFAGPDQGQTDGFVARFDGAGTLLWATRVAAAGRERPTAICPDGAGGVFVVGTVVEGDLGGAPVSSEGDSFVARVDGAGHVAWVRRVGIATRRTGLTSVTPDGAGGVFCGGNVLQFNPAYNTVFTARYDGAGALQWATDDDAIDFSGYRVVGDGAGGFYHVGLAYQSSGPDQGLVERRSGTGQVIWSRTVGLCGFTFCPGSTSIGDVAVTSTGSVVLAGRTEIGGSFAEAFVSIHSPQGDLLSHDVFDHPDPFRHGAIEHIALDPRGRLTSITSRTRPPLFEREFFVGRYVVETVGSPVGASACPAEVNSSGSAALTGATGSARITDNDLTLWASGLPGGVFGIFVASQTSGFTPMAGGSQGNLCLGGAIGRFSRPGEIVSSGVHGAFALDVDLTDFPSPAGPVTVLPGQTWFVQAWFRDVGPGGPGSNYGAALQLDFL